MNSSRSLQYIIKIYLVSQPTLLLVYKFKLKILNIIRFFLFEYLIYVLE